MSSKLPLEITEQILSTLWLSPLSPSERATFIKSSHLVSKTWSAIFARVAARDVHILSASHGLKFMDALAGHSCLNYPLDHLCRSITFEHEHKFLLPGPAKDEQLLGRVIHEILRALFTSPFRLPHLRRVAVMVKNFLTETLFEHHPFIHMPYQVRELDVLFSYGEETYPLDVQAIKSKRFDKFDMRRGSLPFLRRLRVKGTSIGVAKELLEACGGRERLLVFEQDAWKEEQPKQPVVLPSVYKDEDFGDDDESDEEDGDEEFYDCEEERRVEKSIEDSWSDSEYEEALIDNFSKDQLIRILSAFQRHLLTTA
ncbi:hypothetical protein VNI00_015357 [Paramarasmius palmivorus]|uniref:F-box domain-containing protein n=1 Tax=Paramarasmius palmivorus TaxID=297713 RepID=A0AAW0BLM9_9AGAR